jgi:alpha-galactosidase
MRKNHLTWASPNCFILGMLALVLNAMVLTAPEDPQPPTLALTPPMGWNSYDGYGVTINEADFKANAEWFAKHLKPLGWQYVVIDAEWYVTDPIPEGNSKTFHYTIDNFGRYTPALNRFPSAAGDVGFKPLADYVHSLGLKFGIHILRGIPKQAVEKDLAIAGSQYHATGAANTADTCPWNYDNYGVDANRPAAQAYYDSIAEQYAGWGVDLIKADCISSHPYKGDEIRLLSSALRKTGRPIVLSLSPGPAPLEKADELRQYAHMWRISDDVWDLWHSDAKYPQGVGDQFANAARWAQFSAPGHWPDADMLPIGHLGPAPGWGKARASRLTRDEQRTLMTLWSIFRSPLMIGGKLPDADPWTISLLTNPEVLAVDQHSTGSRVASSTEEAEVWLAKPASGNAHYLAIFNTSSETQKLQYNWKELGLDSGEYRLRDLWKHKDLESARGITVTLPSHGCALYSLTIQ